MCIHAHARTHTHTHTHTYAYTHIHTYTHTHTHTHTLKYTHTHMHIHMHIHTHTAHLAIQQFLCVSEAWPFGLGTSPDVLTNRGHDLLEVPERIHGTGSIALLSVLLQAIRDHLLDLASLLCPVVLQRRSTDWNVKVVVVYCSMCWQHASVSQGWICSDNCMCCHTEMEDAQ